MTTMNEALLSAPVGFLYFKEGPEDRGWWVKGEDGWRMVENAEATALKVRERDALVKALEEWCEELRSAEGMMGKFIAQEIEQRVRNALTMAAANR